MVSILVFSAIEFGGNVHTFLIQELENLKKYSDEIHLVCLEPKCDYSELTKLGIDLHFINRKSIYIKALKLFQKSNGTIEDIKASIRSKSFSISYLIDLVKHFVLGQAIYEKIKCVINEVNKKEKILVESYWLEAGAYGVARAKKDYPNIISAARAHSIEIDPKKNKFCHLEYKQFIDKYLDKIVFISKDGRNLFVNNIRSKYPEQRRADICVIRLGSKKLYRWINKGSSDSTFRIVSCSRVSPVKRVELIAQALKAYSGKSVIEWTHIGSGDGFNALSELCKEISNENVRVVLKGDMSNVDVQSYYCNNPVDLFINVSKSEGIPVSIMEAMSYGIPIVATNVGGTSELVTDDLGILVDENISPEDIMDTILLFIEMKEFNAREYANYQNNAFSFWNTNFNIEECYKEYMEFILK